MGATVHMTDLIAPAFYGLHKDFRAGEHTHYWLKGGRGSTKSSFASLEIILGVMANRDANATVLRKVGDTLKDSVYEQYLWAIDKLGVAHLWHDTISPIRLTYKPTGQRIVFKGADKPHKLKSAKFRVGYNRYMHYEEVDEFGNMDDIRMINQSLIRGGDSVQVLYSYNPPRSSANWIIAEVDAQGLRADTRVHHSDYRTVPEKWNGESFLAEAAFLKDHAPQRYEHEYLGIQTGTGAEVFTNVTKREITTKEIESFDRINRGLDHGFAADPEHYTENYYRPNDLRLFIFTEIHKAGMSTRDIAAEIKRRSVSPGIIIADTNEPRTNSELSKLGLRIEGAKKGPGSVEHGIKWLQDLAEIVIDPVRCPNTVREFTEYELETDKHGNLRGEFPDKNNHSIDATRYSLEPLLASSKWLV